jgi:hypothetical protein
MWSVHDLRCICVVGPTRRISGSSSTRRLVKIISENLADCEAVRRRADGFKYKGKYREEGDVEEDANGTINFPDGSVYQGQVHAF